MQLLAVLSLLFTFFTTITNADSTFSPAHPPAIPLAVRSPYLSTWLNAGGARNTGFGGNLAGSWAVHWSQQTTGWTGMIRVDGKVFTWMGAISPKAVEQKSFKYTSTKSTFTMEVDGKVQMIITFLSPVTPNDMKRQSLTMSYMEVTVSSLDDKPHDVQIYTDISAQWASGEITAEVSWSQATTGDVAYHRVWRSTQSIFDENGKPDGNGMANWGNVYYAAKRDSDLSTRSGEDTVVRNEFINTGKLDNSNDSEFRPIGLRWPVFAFAKDLDLVSKPVSTLFTIGLLQKDAIQFLGANGTSAIPSLWTSYFSTEESALSWFHNDYSSQQGLSTSLDNQVVKDSVAAAGQDYLTITSLAVRQAFGATQLVGTPSKTFLFMKEISSNGNTQTVDVIFPLHPILLYFNPKLMKNLLDPLYEQQESGHWPHTYSIHDLGYHYPNATGHADGNDEEMPVEECGNMLIMTLAYAQRTGDVNYLKQHYKLLNQWTGFLVNDSLIPANQLSTDDFAGPLQNQTNLALKGIIGIQAMSEVSRLTRNTADAKKYHDIAHEYINKWQDLGIAKGENPPHTTLNYGYNQSWGLLYNIWADKELGLNLVPQSVYDMQDEFYPTQQAKYGVRLDTRKNWTKADWEMFAAAAANSKEVREMFVKLLARFINGTPMNRPFSDLYDVDTGDWPGVTFTARPVVGGVFALLVNPPSKRVASDATVWKA
ncbi:DUF1793-domain-containing protein [Tothia fuscella]|uniref:DUF1793-domain-containing protein n=1 Tax=Tothia fuscella TaxID=1048955 RepID=A0A9P4U081_9PEZI|nr:DUF1793-domain-containing protein [Tothia fuscella]